MEELIAKMYLVETCGLPVIELAFIEIDDCKDALGRIIFRSINQKIGPACLIEFP